MIRSPLGWINFSQCFHQITVGHRCNAPALRGEYFCRHHFKRAPLIPPPHSRFEIPELPDRESICAFAIEIAARVAANSLDVHRARTLLSSLRVALATFPPLPRPKPEPPNTNVGAPGASHVGARDPSPTDDRALGPHLPRHRRSQAQRRPRPAR